MWRQHQERKSKLLAQILGVCMSHVKGFRVALISGQKPCPRRQSPTKVIQGITPYEDWHHSFGCSAHACVPKVERNKLDHPETMKCVLLGYGEQ